MSWMCWVRDVWCEALEEWFVEYKCDAIYGDGYYIRKPKRLSAPICPKACKKWKNKEEKC